MAPVCPKACGARLRGELRRQWRPPGGAVSGACRRERGSRCRSWRRSRPCPGRPALVGPALAGAARAVSVLGRRPVVRVVGGVLCRGRGCGAGGVGLVGVRVGRGDGVIRVQAAGPGGPAAARAAARKARRGRRRTGPLREGLRPAAAGRAGAAVAAGAAAVTAGAAARRTDRRAVRSRFRAGRACRGCGRADPPGRRDLGSGQGLPGPGRAGLDVRPGRRRVPGCRALGIVRPVSARRHGTASIRRCGPAGTGGTAGTGC